MTQNPPKTAKIAEITLFPPPTAPKPPESRPPTLSERIDTIWASIEPIQARLLSEATRIDRTGYWSASIVASMALERARHELAVAALSLGIEDDRHHG